MIKPMKDKIVVKMLGNKDTTNSGLYILPSSQDDSLIAEVVAVNENSSNKDIKVGDKVLVQKYGGQEFKLDNKKYIIYHQNCVLGFLEGD